MSGVIKLRFSFQPSILTSNMTFSPPRRLSTFFSVTEVFRRQRFPKLWTPQMESTHLLLLQIAGVTHLFTNAFIKAFGFCFCSAIGQLVQCLVLFEQCLLYKAQFFSSQSTPELLSVPGCKGSETSFFAFGSV